MIPILPYDTLLFPEITHRRSEFLEFSFYIKQHLIMIKIYMVLKNSGNTPTILPKASWHVQFQIHFGIATLNETATC